MSVLRKNGTSSKCREKSFGNKRCFCNDCKKYYTLDPKTREYPEEIRQQAIKTYYAGASGRGVGKVFGFNKANVYNWIKKTAQIQKTDYHRILGLC